MEVLKPRLKDAKLDKRAMKEILVRLIYVEMLGHDASWGHVKALQACSNQSLQTKKVQDFVTSSIRLQTSEVELSNITGDFLWSSELIETMEQRTHDTQTQ